MVTSHRLLRPRPWKTYHDAKEREQSHEKDKEGDETYGERAVKTIIHTFFARFAPSRFSSGRVIMNTLRLTKSQRE